MSNVEYDLDVSGGLMPQVQALIAPPVSEDASKNKKTGKTAEHPYFKRPGKGHNHDSCDACSEGGDLICCDKCPASFHLKCHDPPLDEVDIPMGQWLCHQCRRSKEALAEKSPQPRTKRSNSSSSSSPPTKIKRPKPMDILVKAASMLNPKQFELPREMSEPCQFPGTDKVEIMCNKTRGKTMKSVRKPHELAPGGLVPLPARTCFECRRSCRVGPLLACDYCPLLFHLDCLDPPLTALPAGRWMCPNHVEQYIDSKLVTSTSATERIRLWDRFSGPVDQDAIKTEFFRRVHCENPPFRVKVRLSMRKRVKVPAMVQHHYKNPVSLLPSLRDVLRLTSVLSRNVGPPSPPLPPTPPPPPPPHIPIPCVSDRYNGQVATSMSSAHVNGQSALEPAEENSSEGLNGTAPPTSASGDVMNGACNGSTHKDTKLPDVVSGIIHSDIERELKQLDERLVRLLAYQRIQQLLAQNDSTPGRDLGALIANTLQQQLQSSVMCRPTRYTPLPSQLLTAADIDRISRVFTSPKKAVSNMGRGTRSRCAIRARAILCPVVSKHFYNVRTSEVDPASVRHDASFMGYRPTVSTRFPEAVAMRYRSITIGRGSANDVELDRFGHCNYTSPKHAVIFYDECTKHYELINYSEYGTQVNNIVYSFDFNEKLTSPESNSSSNATNSTSVTASSKTKDEKSANVVATIREIVDKKRRVQRPKPQQRADGRMSASAADGYESLECGCAVATPPTDLSTGWEGTAVLAHGSLIKFGCITFVFSIVECATV